MDVVLRNLLGEPALLLGGVTFLGLLTKRASLEDLITGSIKVMLGYIILQFGASEAGYALSLFGSIFNRAFNLLGIVPLNESIAALAQLNYGQEITVIMTFGMLLNILIARFTRLKYIFLTGHHILYMASMLAALLAVSPLHKTVQLAFGALVLGVSMSVFPAMAQPFMRRITRTNDVAMGHFGTTGFVLAGLIGCLFHRSEETAGDHNLPRVLSFLRDPTMAIAGSMTFLFVLAALLAGQDYVSQLAGDKHYLIFSFKEAMIFGAGIYIIFIAVRMIISELVPAFMGIAERFVPNAKPALDSPVVFPFAPVAVVLGFLFSLLGGIVGMLLLIKLKFTVILPSIVPHFFTGGTAGVFGHATGGKRGAMLGAFVQGLLITFLPLTLLPLLSGLGFVRTTFSDSDFGVVGFTVGKLIELFTKLFM